METKPLFSTLAITHFYSIYEQIQREKFFISILTPWLLASKIFVFFYIGQIAQKLRIFATKLHGLVNPEGVWRD